MVSGRRELRCLYNPTNPDKMVVLPFAAPGDQVRYREYQRGVGLETGGPHTGPNYVWFYAAT